MMYLYIFTFAFILYAKTVQGATSLQDATQNQTISCCDDNCHQIARENDALKKEIENLKIRLESQQVSYEQILVKLNTLVSKNEAQENLLQSISKNRNEELMNALNRINFKLDSINNQTMEGEIKIFSNCIAAQKKTQQNGVHNVTLRNYKIPFPVYCEENEFCGGWTVIQRRQDGSVDFYRNWTEYQNGFGNLNGEFFIGLDKLHALTSESSQELLIELETFDNDTRYAKYDEFAIGGETEDYALLVLGNYSGVAGDSLSFHKNMKFSTKDRDNDAWSTGNCAKDFKGAWWFNVCTYSHLNGVYSKDSKVDESQGINWYEWKGDYYSFKRAKMLIRPKKACKAKQRRKSK